MSSAKALLDLPEDVRTLIILYMEERPELADPLKSQGLCCTATFELMNRLNTVLPVGVTLQAIDWYFFSTEEKEGYEGPSMPDEYREMLLNHARELKPCAANHMALRVGEWIVDLTARQFDPLADWPYIWRIHEIPVGELR
jgi:hypothetical protein